MDVMFIHNLGLAMATAARVGAVLMGQSGRKRREKLDDGTEEILTSMQVQKEKEKGGG